MKNSKGKVFGCGLPVRYWNRDKPPVLSGSGPFWFASFKMAYEFKIDNLMKDDGAPFMDSKGNIGITQPNFYTVMANSEGDAREALYEALPWVKRGEETGTHQALLINEIDIEKFLATTPDDFLVENHPPSRRQILGRAA